MISMTFLPMNWVPAIPVLLKYPFVFNLTLLFTPNLNCLDLELKSSKSKFIVPEWFVTNAGHLFSISISRYSKSFCSCWIALNGSSLFMKVIAISLIHLHWLIYIGCDYWQFRTNNMKLMFVSQNLLICSKIILKIS